MSEREGVLILAATPLGNPADASSRLRDALAHADVIAAEDTRRVRRLAADLGVRIAGKVVSHYDAVEDQRSAALAEYVAVRTETLIPVVPGVPGVQAALAEPLAVAVHAVERSQLQPGDTVAV